MKYNEIISIISKNLEQVLSNRREDVELLSQLIYALEKIVKSIFNEDVKEKFEYLIWNKVITSLLRNSLLYLLLCNYIAVISSLKLALETSLVFLYVKEKIMKEKDHEEIIEFIRKRSRGGKVFTLKMVKQIPGIPGPYRTRIVNVYVKLSYLHHPTHKVFSNVEYLIPQYSSNIFDKCINLLIATYDIILYILLKYFGDSVEFKLLQDVQNLIKEGRIKLKLCSRKVFKLLRGL